MGLFFVYYPITLAAALLADVFNFYTTLISVGTLLVWLQTYHAERKDIAEYTRNILLGIESFDYGRYI